MFALMVLAAAAASPLLKEPVPAAPVEGWLAASDYPAEPAPGPVVLSFALTVSPEGNVLRCAVEASTGSAAFVGKACMLLEQRARFRPAADGAGRPVIGVWRGQAMWAPAGSTIDVPQMIEMAIGLQAMPAGVADPAYLDLAVSTDATGRADGCVVATPLDLAGKPVEHKVEAGRILGQAACAEAMKTLKLEPARTADGKAEPAVQTARLLFTAQPAALSARSDPRNDITVQGKREARITSKGFSRIVDYQAVGDELVLIQADGGQWYRMELQPPCIGNSRLTRMSKDGAEIQVDQEMIERLPRELRDALFLQQGLFKILPPGMVLNENLGFTNRSDGSIDRSVEVVATTIDNQDIIHIESCRIRSLVASDPPAGIKGKRPK